MTAEHGSASDNLLEQIATTEQELEQNVAQARDDARRVVDEARARADAVRQAAQRDADDLANRTRRDIARDTDAMTAQRLADAEAEAHRVRTQAAERMATAVQMVVTRVLAGLE